MATMNQNRQNVPPEDPKAMAAFTRWVNRKAKEYEEDEELGYWLPGSPEQKRMVAFWKEYRPQMYQRLQQRKLVEKLAFVLENRAVEAARMYQAAGMPWPDYREQAKLEWFLLDPESEEAGDNPEEATEHLGI